MSISEIFIILFFIQVGRDDLHTGKCHRHDSELELLKTHPSPLSFPEIIMNTTPFSSESLENVTEVIHHG